MRLLPLLGALLLSGCAHTPTPVPPDSLGAECPAAAIYTLPPDAPLKQLHEQATTRLARLGLATRWEAPEAQAFVDTAADRERLRRLLAVLLPAYERYPSAAWAAIGLRELVIVKDLQVGGQLRRAMPAAERDALLYADLGGAAPCPGGVELRAHHELYHFIEHRRSGSYYPPEPRWLALNPPHWRYGAGGAAAYGPGFQNLGHPQPGAVSRYALYGAEEDRAEVFGWWMTPAYRERLRRYAAIDPPLAAKLRGLRALLPVALQTSFPEP